MVIELLPTEQAKEGAPVPGEKFEEAHGKGNKAEEENDDLD